MKILILGQGGREHAFVKALKRTTANSEIHVFPGNDGMTKEALCFTDRSLGDTAFIEKLCTENRYDFVFIGPEDPLVTGVSDRLRNLGFNVVGPSQHWAQLEGSKVFAKEFMIKANIPTAKYVLVESVDQVRKHVQQFSPPYVLKADGLAAGKGVFICDTPDELFTAAENIFEKKTLGSAGSKAALEQFTPGWELSYLFFTNGKDYVSLPIAQDHKRLYNGQKGPNTGGMGTWAPLEISKELDQNIRKKVIEPTMAEISKSNSVYRGVIFLGIMVEGNDPSVLEYNVRMGDPETQSILPLVESNLGEFLLDLAKGNLGELKLNRSFASCVVLASPGYPDSPKKGLPIEGYDAVTESTTQHLIASGVKKENNQWTTHGGRVLGAVGIATTKDEAIKNAYSLAEKVKWPGIHFRTDIGTSN
tara:strand:- start:14647 stop:15903 length:1257 start_codon:yes stop_codon:yes gene_type:complete